jgi:hypothetical protein
VRWASRRATVVFPDPPLPITSTRFNLNPHLGSAAINATLASGEANCGSTELRKDLNGPIDHTVDTHLIAPVTAKASSFERD